MNDLNFTPQVVDSYWVLTPPTPLPYVSLTAISRVADKLPPPTVCPDCNGPVQLVNNKEIYGHSVGNWPFAYHCQGCGESYVGVHPDTAIPLGYMAGKVLRTARQTAKTSFFAYIVASGVDKKSAYIWLAKMMNLPLGRTHYGWFDADQCAKAFNITEEARKKCLTN